jgi:CBS domain-containing protein
MPHRPIRQIIANGKLVTAGEHTTVAEAARLMNQEKVGAVLVVHHDHLTGIFTERDAITRVMAEGLDPAHTRLAKVMTRDPQTIPPERPFAHALITMHEHGFRHMPVVDRGRLLGMVSLRDALPPELDELRHDLLEREHIAEILA